MTLNFSSLVMLDSLSTCLPSIIKSTTEDAKIHSSNHQQKRQVFTNFEISLRDPRAFSSCLRLRDLEPEVCHVDKVHRGSAETCARVRFNQRLERLDLLPLAYRRGQRPHNILQIKVRLLQLRG